MTEFVVLFFLKYVDIIAKRIDHFDFMYRNGKWFEAFITLDF